MLLSPPKTRQRRKILGDLDENKLSKKAKKVSLPPSTPKPKIYLGYLESQCCGLDNNTPQIQTVKFDVFCSPPPPLPPLPEIVTRSAEKKLLNVTSRVITVSDGVDPNRLPKDVKSLIGYNQALDFQSKVDAHPTVRKELNIFLNKMDNKTSLDGKPVICNVASLPEPDSSSDCLITMVLNYQTIQTARTMMGLSGFKARRSDGTMRENTIEWIRCMFGETIFRRTILVDGCPVVYPAYTNPVDFLDRKHLAPSWRHGRLC